MVQPQLPLRGGQALGEVEEDVQTTGVAEADRSEIHVDVRLPLGETGLQGLRTAGTVDRSISPSRITITRPLSRARIVVRITCTAASASRPVPKPPRRVHPYGHAPKVSNELADGHALPSAEDRLNTHQES